MQLDGRHVVYEVSDNWLTPVSFNFLDRGSSVTLRGDDSTVKTDLQFSLWNRLAFCYGHFVTDDKAMIWEENAVIFVVL